MLTLRGIFLITNFVAGFLALECVFDAKMDAVQLNVHDGTDTCETTDSYCMKLMNLNGVYAKGCSKTAQKITEQSLRISCDAEGCNPAGTLCCCKGNKCNSSSKITQFASLLMLAAVKFIF